MNLQRHHVVAAGVAALLVSAAVGAGSAQADVSRTAANHVAPQPGRASVLNYSSALAKSPGYKVVSSPAGKSVRLRDAAKLSAAPKPSSGTVIYAQANSSNQTCTTDSGNGSQSNPYCSLQDAVNAAASGDSISIENSNYQLPSTATITISNLTISGAASSDQVQLLGGITLSGVSGVSLSNLTIQARNVSAVAIEGSSNITLNELDLVAIVEDDDLVIDGASSAVTVTRSIVSTSVWVGDGIGAEVEAGAKNIDFSSDIFAPFGVAEISATGVGGLTLAGNTIQRSCGGGILVSGSSTGVSMEDNVLEDANVATNDVPGGSSKGDCVQDSEGWAADVVVDASSAAGSVADYNDFYSYGTDDTAPYTWSGTTYPTLTAFRSGVSQGAHDTGDSVEFGRIPTSPGSGVMVDAKPVPNSVADDSANVSAAGELSSDFYGTSPYNTRGAVQYTDPNPTLAVGLTAEPTGALTISVTANVTSGAGINYTWYISCGTTEGTSTLYGNGPSSFTLTCSYSQLGTYTLSAYVTDSFGKQVQNSVSATTIGSDYTAFGPTRLLDTRYGIGGPVGQLQANQTVHLPVAGYGGVGGIPLDVTAVVLNLTVTDAHGSGFISAYDDGDPDGVPTVSNVNYTAGQTVPNLAVVPVGADGDVALYNGGTLAGGVDLIADVTGYFTQSQASGYTSLTPDRLVDTRNGTGVSQGQVGQNGTITVQIAGADNGNLPQTGITAVALNVTVTGPHGSGFLTAYPYGQPLPNASNVNYGVGQTIANSVVVPVSPTGLINITNSGATAKGTDIVVDVVGYYSPKGTSAYLPIYPSRVLDTRSASWGDGPLPNDAYIWLGVGLDENGQNDLNITGAVLNATVTNTKGQGFLTVAPDPNNLWAYENDDWTLPTPPNSSALNWTPKETVPNLVQASTGGFGLVDFWNLGDNGNTTDLIVDVFGFYQDAG